ncbi:MAG TPA: ubiquinol-cytochrome C chaperone family protein [Alphaproteobacteria bacterium]|nr:hypothetical protein [Rhodospirillaceae bacterium]HRJ12122.1 ubiquinol-cytochrome C chaperone family protein [Alphaproteobacteria bacterium]
MILGQANKRRRQTASQIYDVIVTQSRTPELYLYAGVPDTLDGRFDCIILHASMVIHFLADATESGQSMAQELFDTMFRDFTHNLRHIGIGDLSVARHFRRMSEGFNGRLRAYADAFQAKDEKQLSEALARNVFRTTEMSPHVKKLSDYVWLQFEHLSEIDIQKMKHGEFTFAAPSLE